MATIVKPVKSFLTAFAKAGFAVAAILPSAAWPQDTLLVNPRGEIVFDGGDPAELDVAAPDPAYNELLSAAERRKAENEDALRRLNDAMVVSNERRAELSESVAALDTDRGALVDQLIETARSIQNLEDSLTATERKLESLGDEERRLRRSLAARRAVLAEVLAALQRMGQNPPPAIVVSASDVLQSVRSAILLGSVLPEMRAEAEALKADLLALDEVAQTTQLEQNALIDQERQLSEEQLRLDLLIKENQKLRVSSSEKLDKEREKITLLAGRATNLRDLIEDISLEIENVASERSQAENAARRDAQARRAAEEAQRQREVAALSELRPVEPAPDNAAFSSLPSPVLSYQGDGNETQSEAGDARRVLDYANLLSGKDAAFSRTPFAENKGNLRFPARGTELTTFGGSDGLGGVSEGISVRTRAKAPVTAPADGLVVFAGPFPGFEQLLIIDAGDGYHIVMAGMEAISAAIGDRVKAGELVAVMGGKRQARLAGLSADIASVLDNDFSGSQTQPILYVEFRKDGKSINSMPWWAKS